MTVQTRQCDARRIADFLGGRLSEPELAVLEEHLSACAACRASLDAQTAGDELWDKASRYLRDEDEELESPPGVGDSAAEYDQTYSIQHVLDALAPTDDPAMLGRLGAYEISGVVGSGGMGVVLKALDRSLDRMVAIKVMAPHLATNGAARKRFAREAKAAAAVLHPNVMAIHSVSSGDSLPFLVMPYMRGTSLQKRLDAEGPLSVGEILRIAAQTAAGLAAAHAQGLVHRDIKPANILLEEGVERVAITDFGLARAVDDATMTRTGVIAGTPQYMSPEQARGESVDQRSDLFSLGSVLYAMCTGRPPFRAESSYGVLRRITDEEPKSIREINPDIPEWLCRLISRLMAKSSDARFENALEVAELLEQCLAHVQQPTSVPLPASLVSHAAGRRSIFNVTRKGLIAMLGTIGMTLLGMVLWQMTEAPDISGQWNSDEWGAVVLEAKGIGKYEGTFSGPGKGKPVSDLSGPFGGSAGGPEGMSGGGAGGPGKGTSGTLQLKWSRVERRFNGTWETGDDRSGKMSLRLVDNEIRGAWTANKSAQKESASPRLADLLWTRSQNAASEVAQAPTVLAMPERPNTFLDRLQGTWRTSGEPMFVWEVFGTRIIETVFDEMGNVRSDEWLIRDEEGVNLDDLVSPARIQLTAKDRKTGTFPGFMGQKCLLAVDGDSLVCCNSSTGDFPNEIAKRPGALWVREFRRDKETPLELLGDWIVDDWDRGSGDDTVLKSNDIDFPIYALRFHTDRFWLRALNDKYVESPDQRMIGFGDVRQFQWSIPCESKPGEFLLTVQSDNRTQLLYGRYQSMRPRPQAKPDRLRLTISRKPLTADSPSASDWHFECHRAISGELDKLLNNKAGAAKRSKTANTSDPRVPDANGIYWSDRNKDRWVAGMKVVTWPNALYPKMVVEFVLRNDSSEAREIDVDVKKGSISSLTITKGNEAAVDFKERYRETRKAEPGEVLTFEQGRRDISFAWQPSGDYTLRFDETGAFVLHDKRAESKGRAVPFELSLRVPFEDSVENLPIRWSEPRGGLRLGAMFVGAKKGETPRFRQGDQAAIQLFVQNMTKQEVNFTFEPHDVDGAWIVGITDRAGVKMEPASEALGVLKGEFNPSDLYVSKLAPGEIQPITGELPTFRDGRIIPGSTQHVDYACFNIRATKPKDIRGQAPLDYVLPVGRYSAAISVNLLKPETPDAKYGVDCSGLEFEVVEGGNQAVLGKSHPLNITSEFQLPSRPLLDAVAEFNRKMEIEHPQHGQPPLTDEEVIAAISWALMDLEKNRIAESQTDLKSIAQRRLLPQHLDITGGPAVSRADDRVIQGWSVRIARRATQESEGDTVFSVRERYLQPPKEFLQSSIKPATGNGTPLQEAIDAFNRNQKVLGQKQPPLTLDEVLAAILQWKTKRAEIEIDDATLQTLQHIASTHTLPENAIIEHQSEFLPGDGARYHRWTAGIRLNNVGAQTTTTFDVREQFIRAEFSDEGAVQWGPPGQNGLQAGVRFNPAQATYVVGQPIKLEFFFRTFDGRNLQGSLPRVFTFDAIEARDPTGERLQVLRDAPEIVGGWMSTEFGAKPTSRAYETLTIVAGEEDESKNIERALSAQARDSSVVLVARPGTACRVRFTVRNYADGAEGKLQTGEVAFRVNEVENAATQLGQTQVSGTANLKGAEKAPEVEAASDRKHIPAWANISEAPNTTLDGVWDVVEVSFMGQVWNSRGAQVVIEKGKWVGFSPHEHEDGIQNTRRDFVIGPDNEFHQIETRGSQRRHCPGRYKLDGDCLWLALQHDSLPCETPVRAIPTVIEPNVTYYQLQRRNSRNAATGGAAYGIRGKAPFRPRSIEAVTEVYNAHTAALRSELFKPPIPDLTIEQMKAALTTSAEIQIREGMPKTGKVLQKFAATGRLSYGILLGYGTHDVDENGATIARSIVPTFVIAAGDKVEPRRWIEWIQR